MPYVRFEKYYYCDYCEFHAFTKEAVESHEKTCQKRVSSEGRSRSK